MILPDPIIFAKPLHVWLGLLTFLLLLTQITLGLTFVMTGKKNVFWAHTKLIWVLLLVVAIIHGFYGFEIYFLK